MIRSKATKPRAGDVFGRWEVLGDSKGDSEKVDCRCSCGTERSVRCRNLTRGLSRSCGCLSRERVREMGRRNTWSSTHGLSGTPTFQSWRAMIRRTSSPKDANWRYYGGRGITVCARWQGAQGAQNFLADMGERPEGKTLDRIDPDGNYEPSNCRWATPLEQTQNRRQRTTAPQFVVEVSYPHSEVLQEEVIRCESVQGLTDCLDEKLPLGREACEEIAESVAAGEPFSAEHLEEESTVEARVAGGRV